MFFLIKRKHCFSWVFLPFPFVRIYFPSPTSQKFQPCGKLLCFRNVNSWTVCVYMLCAREREGESEGRMSTKTQCFLWLFILRENLRVVSYESFILIFISLQNCLPAEKHSFRWLLMLDELERKVKGHTQGGWEQSQWNSSGECFCSIFHEILIVKFIKYAKTLSTRDNNDDLLKFLLSFLLSLCPFVTRPCWRIPYFLTGEREKLGSGKLPKKPGCCK